MSISERGAAVPATTPHYLLTIRNKKPWTPAKPRENHVMLCVAENTLTEDLLQAKLRATAVPAELVCGYPPNRGLPAVNAAFAQYLTRTFLKGLEVDPYHITTASGCGSIIDLLFFAIANPGDSVLIPAPYYPSFDSDLTLRNGLVPTPLDLGGGGAGPEAALEAAAAAAAAAGRPAAALLLTNPGNPDGVLISRGDLTACLEWCCRRGVHLVSDEIYANSVFQPEGFHSMLSVVAEHPSAEVRQAAKGLLHLIYGLSKDWCANGLRVGCLHSQHPGVLASMDSMGYFAQISSIAQEVLTSVLEDTSFVDSFLAENRRRLQQAYEAVTSWLKQAGIPFTPADGAIFVWVDLTSALPEPTWEAEAAFYQTLMDEAGVILTPGRTCHAPRPGFFRICYAAVSPEGLAEGLARLTTFLEKTRSNREARVAVGTPPPQPRPTDAFTQKLKVAG